MVGDLILNKDWYLHPEAWAWVGSWDLATQRANARMVVCMANTVIPGHGPMFQVPAPIAPCVQYRRPFLCTDALS